MLNRIIYCGQPSLNKFILINFPEENRDIEQSRAFEDGCAKISAIIYPHEKSGYNVEILNNDLQNFNIDALYQKNNKLRTLDEWNHQKFDEKMGNKTNYGVIVGKTCTGKTTVANFMANNLNMGIKVIDMKKIKKDNPPLDGEGNPVEGEECKLSTVEEIIVKMIRSEPATRWVFDEYLHDKEEEFFAFIS
jgi:hypothetical protein